MDKKPILKMRSSKASHSKAEIAGSIDEFSKIASIKNPVPALVAPTTFTSRTTAAPKVSIQTPPTKIEPIRFTKRRSGGGGSNNAARILVFLVVVIAIGVAATLFVQNYANQQNANTASSSSSQIAAIPGTSIATSVLPDSQALTAPTNADYIDTDVNIGSASNDVTAVELAQLSYQPYVSFSRVEWNLSGVTHGLPAVKFTLNPDTNTVLVTFTGIDATYPEMLQLIPLSSGNLTAINGTKNATNLEFTLQLKEPGKYFVSISQAQDKVTLDLKTVAKLEEPASSSSASVSVSSSSASSVSSVSSTSSVASSSSSAGGISYDNTASQDAQSIVSSVTGNSIKMQNYYYEDFGPKFEFSWAMQNTGAASIPNTTARYITDSGKKYIEVQISNLSQDVFYAFGWNKATFGINMQYTNVNNVLFKGRTNGVSKYWVEVKHQANYRLFATKTKNNNQLLSIEIFD